MARGVLSRTASLTPADMSAERTPAMAFGRRSGLGSRLGVIAGVEPVCRAQRRLRRVPEIVRIDGAEPGELAKRAIPPPGDGNGRPSAAARSLTAATIVQAVLGAIVHCGGA